MAQERTTFALASPCGSMMSLSPSVEGDGKRTMQTTVAIVEENPHRFKIQPLKQVPTEKRPVASPSFNFERPYVGCRLGLPSMYQLAPSRTASTYSFNSVNSDTGTAQTTMAEPASPTPGSVFDFDVSEERGVENRYAGLGFEDMPDNASLAATSAYPSFSSEVSNDSRSVTSSQSQYLQDTSWMEFSGPDLTFATSENSSAHSRINTPADVSTMSPSVSTESSRKAKSMMVLNGLSNDAMPYRSTSEVEFIPSISSGSLRRLRAKTLSVSTSENARAYRHKRHAIYGQHAMQFSLSSGANRQLLPTIPSTPDQEFDMKSLEPSPCVLAVERKAAANNIPKKSSTAISKRDLDFVEHNLPASSHSALSVPAAQPEAINTAAVHATEPLRITGTRSTQLLQKIVRSSSSQDRSGLGNVHRHPLIEDLFREIDLAISEWRVVPYL